MRFAGNFHPEWGYLAPAPNFMRTARVVIVATAIGATAGAAVVLSLAERSAPGAVTDAGKTLVVVHSLVQPAEAAAPAAAPVAAATPAPHRDYRARCAGRSGDARQSTSQRSTRTGRSAGHAATERAACYGQCAADRAAAAARAEQLAHGLHFGGAGERYRAVGKSAGDRGFTARGDQGRGRFACSLAPQKDAIKKPAATGQSQQPQRGPQPAIAAAPKKKPEERGLGPVSAPAVQRELSAGSQDARGWGEAGT